MNMENSIGLKVLNPPPTPNLEILMSLGIKLPKIVP